MSVNVHTPKKTQEEFEHLPALVSRSVFQEWTGLGDRALRQLVEEQKIEVYRRSEKSYARYYKREIGELMGFRM